MLISWHGHAEFYLEGSDGFSLLTDPYDAHVGYPIRECPADGVTVSHGHGDHSFTEKVTGSPRIIRTAGVHALGPDVRVTAIPCFHDEKGGALRGENLIMKIEMDDLTVVHLGDLGHMPDEELLAALGQVDILLIPVGGHYTIDGEAACRIVRAVQPAVAIPMHFKQPGIHDGWPISDEMPFLQGMGAAGCESMPMLRVTRGDLSQQPPVALLSCH